MGIRENLYLVQIMTEMKDPVKAHFVWRMPHPMHVTDLFLHISK